MVGVKQILTFVFSLSFSLMTQAQNLQCPEYKFESSEFSFKSFNPSVESILNVVLPGTNQTLFRGAYDSNPQFDFEKALAGLFNQKNWYVGSPVFFGITQVLSGKWGLDHDFLPKGNLPYQMKDYFEARRILPEIETLLRCRGNRTYTLEQSEVLAADLMNKVFKRMTPDQIENRYFNIAHPDYGAQSVQKLGFGNNAADLIISSNYDLVAALYGRKILVLEDKRHRALDLGFYNLKKNGYLFRHWVDNGEINSPGYIRADELLGYQQRRVDRIDDRTKWGRTIPNSPIEIAIYKTKVNGENVVLLLDGEESHCIIAGQDQRYYRCQPYWDKLMEAVPSPFPKASTHRIGLMGVITQCSDNNDCPIVEKVKTWYGRLSNKTLDTEWIRRIEALTVNGKKLLYKPTTYVSAPVPRIDVISASYRTASEVATDSAKGNVTQSAASFLNGKTSSEYKISSRYLSLIGPQIPRQFEIEWKCSGSIEKTKSLTIDLPAENEIIEISCSP